jgi:hypothetical protein
LVIILSFWVALIIIDESEKNLKLIIENNYVQDFKSWYGKVTIKQKAIKKSAVKFEGGQACRKRNKRRAKAG